jgi:NAD(P)-dependent dehydrogenase (short-subunit alcohol dehydrogenase family)
MEITNETVGIITGASSGIGRALALRLAKEGARLGIIARRRDRLEDLAGEIEGRGGEALILPCDVTRREELERAVAMTIERFGGLDLLVNNAGRGHLAYIEETPTEQIESIFRVNVFSLWYGTAPAVRWMRRQGRGHIINIASMAGKIGFPGNAAYVAAKHATVGFTRALRTELAGTGVEATVVCPGGVLTEWAEVAEGGSMLEIFDYERSRGEEIARERGGEQPPAIPLLSPGEVAEAIVETIRSPRPELYTHPGTREIADRYQLDQEGVERLYEPFHLANREAWERRS